MKVYTFSCLRFAKQILPVLLRSNSNAITNKYFAKNLSKPSLSRILICYHHRHSLYHPLRHLSVFYKRFKFYSVHYQIFLITIVENVWKVENIFPKYIQHFPQYWYFHDDTFKYNAGIFEIILVLVFVIIKSLSMQHAFS